jgi:hypothetical protein
MRQSLLRHNMYYQTQTLTCFIEVPEASLGQVNDLETPLFARQAQKQTKRAAQLERPFLETLLVWFSE